MKKNINDIYVSIFSSKNKTVRQKSKEANNRAYYQNFLANTENIFIKNDANGSRSQRYFKLNSNVIEYNFGKDKKNDKPVGIATPAPLVFGKITLIFEK